MRFEHLVEINDPSDPQLTPLTRDDLWFGLLCRAEDPRPFLPGLDVCEILVREDTRLSRRLVFGQAIVLDEVTLDPGLAVAFTSQETAEHAGGSLRISIEEPELGRLFLRFIYQTSLPDDPDAAERRYSEIVKSAYHESDLDTVKVIRMIAASTRPQ